MIEAVSSARTTSNNAEVASSTLIDTEVVTIDGSPWPSGASSGAAWRAAAGSAKSISTIVVPSDAFNSVAVPSAMTLPMSMTMMLSARRSASSRYWVVSNSVVPVVDEVRDDAPQVDTAPGIEPGGGLVEEENLRAVHERRGEVEPPAHPA